MTSLELHHETATNDNIAALCSDSNHVLLGGTPYGNKVVKLSDIAVVKFGVGVKEDEANNQKRAYELVDHSIVRVPFVYRFFSKEGLGYIVMEHMQGRVLKPVEDPSLMDRITYVLTHLAKIHHSIPGALGGGKSRGSFWSEGEEPSLHTVKDLEKWFNRRLLKQHHKLVFSGSELVLCHLDIAPRNFLLLQDDSLCLLDWASTGFYPRIFEVCALRITHGREGSFPGDVLKLEDLTDEEESHIKLMLEAYYNSMRFHL